MTCTGCQTDFVPPPPRPGGGHPRTRCDACRAYGGTKREPVRRPPRSTADVEAITNVSQAITELERARDEMRQAEAITGNRFERQRAMLEPLSRLDLAKRFIAATLRKHGWKPIEGDS